MGGSARHARNHRHASLTLIASKSNLERVFQPRVDHGPSLFPVLARSSSETVKVYEFLPTQKSKIACYKFSSQWHLLLLTPVLSATLRWNQEVNH